MTEANPKSPISFLEIGETYCKAFDIIWEVEFEEKHRFHYDWELIFQPLSQLIGHSLEVTFKGLLVCRGTCVGNTHDLVDLFDHFSDQSLVIKLNKTLTAMAVKDDLLAANERMPTKEVSQTYRTFRHQLGILNENYSRPYATRYQVNGFHSLPSLKGLRAALQILSQQLQIEARHWGLAQPK